MFYLCSVYPSFLTSVFMCLKCFSCICYVLLDTSVFRVLSYVWRSVVGLMWPWCNLAAVVPPLLGSDLAFVVCVFSCFVF